MIMIATIFHMFIGIDLIYYFSSGKYLDLIMFEVIAFDEASTVRGLSWFVENCSLMLIVESGVFVIVRWKYFKMLFWLVCLIGFFNTFRWFFDFLEHVCFDLRSVVESNVTDFSSCSAIILKDRRRKRFKGWLVWWIKNKPIVNITIQYG